MNTTVKLTPEQERDRAIERAKATYKESIAQATRRYKFDVSDANGKAKLIDGLLQVDKNAGQKLWHRVPTKERLEVARALIGKAMVIKARVSEHSYLTSSLRITDSYFEIEAIVRPGIVYRTELDFKSRPEFENVEHYVKQWFPNVKVELI